MPKIKIRRRTHRKHYGMPVISHEPQALKYAEECCGAMEAGWSLVVPKSIRNEAAFEALRGISKMMLVDAFLAGTRARIFEPMPVGKIDAEFVTPKKKDPAKARKRVTPE